jgi:hypothetical protein
MKPTFQEALAGAALVILGGLGFMLMFVSIPQANSTSFTFILGALSGAITTAGGQKVATALGAGAKVNTGEVAQDPLGS